MKDVFRDASLGSKRDIKPLSRLLWLYGSTSVQSFCKSTCAARLGDDKQKTILHPTSSDAVHTSNSSVLVNS